MALASTPMLSSVTVYSSTLPTVSPGTGTLRIFIPVCMPSALSSVTKASFMFDGDTILPSGVRTRSSFICTRSPRGRKEIFRILKASIPWLF